jgi:Methyltransferase domain
VAIRDLTARVHGRARVSLGQQRDPNYDMGSQELEPSEAARLLAESKTDLGRMIFGHKGRIVHKWTHYPDIYERHLAGYRGSSFRMLEIGVFRGGSLELWREYFGSGATIYGIDINPECAAYVDAPNEVRIGSQDDPDFLTKVVTEMGGIDVVLDDGSHVASHQRASFATLFPLLNDGGLYIIEDLHTAYWPGPFEGGYRRSGTAIELVKSMIDDMHGWYHGKGSLVADCGEIDGIHIYDSMVIIEKKRRDAPQHIKVG